MKMIMKSFAILLFLGYTFFLIFHPQTKAVNHAASVLINKGLDMPVNMKLLMHQYSMWR